MLKLLGIELPTCDKLFVMSTIGLLLQNKTTNGVLCVLVSQLLKIWKNKKFPCF